jgi:hypothetical protein
MSLARRRRSSRFVAALLLVVSAFGLPHRAQSDDVCVPFGVEEHDESNHVFTGVTTAEHPQHCAVCHWLRWMKPVFSSSAVSAVQRDAGADVVSFADTSLRDPASDHIPARAPPAL